MAELTYKIVSASSVKALEEFVNQNLLLGYKLQGGVCAVQELSDATKTFGDNACTLKDCGIVYLQALVWGKA